MSRFELKDFVPTNPLDAAANAIDPIAFLGNWPNRKLKARVTVAKVLRALRDTESWPEIIDAVDGGVWEGDEDFIDDMRRGAGLRWKSGVDAVLKHAPEYEE